MTSPAALATMATNARAQIQRTALDAELTVLNRRFAEAAAERVQATHAANQARGLKENAAKLLSDHRDLLPMLPPDPRRDERIENEAAEVERLRDEMQHARAWLAAAKTVEEAASVEADLCKQHMASLARPAGDGAFKPLSGLPDSVVVATRYDVAHRLEGEQPVQMRVSRRQAVGLVDAWSRAHGARVLRNGAGVLAIEAPGRTIELRPVTLRVPPTEGAVIAAALAAYGLRSFEEQSRGETWLAVAVGASRLAPLTVQSGTSVTRPVTGHDKPWTLTLHAGGEAPQVLYSGDPGLSLAADSAACARAAAEYAYGLAED